MFGGGTQYVETLDAILAFVEAQHPTTDEVVGWHRGRFTNVSSRESIMRRARYLRQAGFLEQENDHWVLGQAGREYMGEQDTATLFRLMCERNVGLRSLLYALSAGPLTLAEISDQQLDTHPELGWGRGETDMARQRANWLRSMGLVRKQGDTYTLTDEGQRVMSTLASDSVGQVGGTIRYQEDILSPAVARDRVLDLAAESLRGSLDSTDETVKLHLDSLTGPRTPVPAISHSYTSLDVYDDCARQHYLKYVLNAFPEYQPAEHQGPGGVTQRDIGLLFHDTAEQAAMEGTQDRDDWYDICERIASQQRSEDALASTKRCIDRYFHLELTNYEVIDAEREFELDIDGNTLMGFIDAVYRTGDDELLVIDYKATEQDRNIQDDKQLPIYLLACRDLYDVPVTRAGYAYVGEFGPAVELRSFSEKDLQAVKHEIATAMNRIAEFSFKEYTAGDHCRWCQHNQLPCAPDPLH
jgi:hypothetical protein